MKFFSRINKGALLSLLVLAGSVIYLVASGTSQTKDQPAIKAACERYIQVAQQYSVLPKDYQDGKTLMTSAQQEQYTTDLKNALTPLFDSGSTFAFNSVFNSFKQNLQPLFSGKTAILSNKITITQYVDFTYTGDLVTVSFKYNLNSNILNSSGYNGTGRNQGNNGVITFKNVEGAFKIVSVSVFNKPAVNRSERNA